MSAPAQNTGFFQGPGTLAFIVGVVMLAIGIWGGLTGSPLILGLGISFFMAGTISKLVRSDALDVILVTIAGIGVVMGLLHTVVSRTSSHDGGHGTPAAESAKTTY